MSLVLDHRTLPCEVTDSVTEIRKNFRRLKAILYNYNVAEYNVLLDQLELNTLRSVVQSPKAKALISRKSRSTPA